MAIEGRPGIIGRSLFLSAALLSIPYNPPMAVNKIPLSEYPEARKISISLEDYASLRGRNSADYNITKLENCDQKIDFNTEMIIKYEKPCKGLALVPK